VRTRGEAVCLLAGGGAADLAIRMAQVALPLVILDGTGSVATTGLVAGAAGMPVLLSPWWARRARQWVDSGRRLAAAGAAEAFALAVVPAAAAAGLLTVAVLVAAGLLLGTAEALSAPGRTALVADVGDRLGPDRAVTLLTAQDGIRRAGLVAGPPLAAIAVTAGLALALLWLQAVMVLITAMLTIPVKPAPTARLIAVPAGEAATAAGEAGATACRRAEAAPRIWSAVRARPEVLLGWVLRGTGCVTWFAFTLGLTVIGVERGRPGVYLAAGMTGYGVGSLVGTGLAVPLVRRFPPVAIACVAWTIGGLCWIGLGLWASPPAAALFAALAGVAVVLGIAAISATITRSSAGTERRALLSGQAVIVNAGAAAGMLIGGPLIAAIGPSPALILAGTVTAAVSLGGAVSAARGTGRGLPLSREADRGATAGGSAAGRRRQAVRPVRPAS
jgi:hypothetical protein